MGPSRRSLSRRSSLRTASRSAHATAHATMGERSGDAKKKFTVLDMSKYVDKELRVKFMGGREVVGILKGYDALLNLVLDETREYLKDPDDPYRLLDETRSLGLTVCRGTAVTLVCPADGFEEIANPFLQEGGDDEEPPEQ